MCFCHGQQYDLTNEGFTVCQTPSMSAQFFPCAFLFGFCASVFKSRHFIIFEKCQHSCDTEAQNMTKMLVTLWGGNWENTDLCINFYFEKSS